MGGGGAQCCECGGFGCGASLDRFVVMMGGEAVSGGGVLSCICLAPQLVCGCSTRAPLAFFLAWGGWRQRGGCAGFLCRTGQVTVRERSVPTLPREIVPPGGKSEGGSISRTAKRGDNFSYCRGVAVLV